MVKDFTNQRNKSANDNYKLMQEIGRIVLGKSPLLEVREVDNNVFRISTSDKEGVSQVRIQMDKVGLPDKINFHKHQRSCTLIYSNPI